jgi:DNA-binding Lrp family transcriptional regulator
MIEDLNKKVNLWFSVLVDSRAIGLSEYFVLLKVSPGKEEPVIDLIWDVPYCTRIHKTYGPTNVIVHFNIPTMAAEFLNQYFHQLQRFNLVEDFFLCSVQRSDYNFNLRYYDAERGGWDVRWDEWGLWLREFLYEKGWYYVLYEEAAKKEEPRIPIKIDKLDLQIINQLVLDSRQPFTEIGRTLGVTGVYVSQKTHKLINQGIVKLITGSYRIGLDEVALLVIDCDSDVAKALSVALNELPMWQGMAITGDIEGLIAMIFVPTGDIGQLFHVIDTYLVQKGAVKKCWLNLVGKWVGKRRPLRWLPIDLYSKGEGWTFEGDKYIEDIKKRLRFME